MQEFRADLHIHTVLSPCADLEMTPTNIIQQARNAQLDIIGITDHNSTKNALVVKAVAERSGIFVLTGVEITTKEEVHCLAFFEKDEQLTDFQSVLDQYLTQIPNPDGHFGYQPVIDANENILELTPNYLAAALKLGISEIQHKVHELEGIFIPAHATRPANGIFAQLGFIPPDLKFDALGITAKTKSEDLRKQFGLRSDQSLVYNSDAHFPNQIGKNFTKFIMEEISFQEIKMALNQQNNRKVLDR